MRTRQMLAGLALTLIALSAAAFDRQFPAEAKRGVASFAHYPKIIINDKEYRPAPGLRIWNTQNVIQFQVWLKAEKVAINYTIDPYKLIDRIWILNPSEAAKAPPANSQQGTTNTITVMTPKTTTTVTTGSGITATQTKTSNAGQ